MFLGQPQETLPVPLQSLSFGVAALGKQSSLFCHSLCVSCFWIPRFFCLSKLTSSQICNHALKLSWNSVLGPSSTSGWHFDSSVCVNKSSPFFLTYFVFFFCHETFHSSMCSPPSWKGVVTSFHLEAFFASFGPLFFGALTVSTCRPQLLASSLYFPSSLSARTSICGPWRNFVLLLFLFLWSDGEVDGDLRPILRPEPRRHRRSLLLLVSSDVFRFNVLSIVLNLWQ